MPSESQVQAAGNSDLSAWLDYQTKLHAKNIALGLDRVHQVWAALGAPRPAQKIITLAGTNGKGSCVALLDSILRTASYQVGAYTSPHLLTYNERICIGGQAIDDQSLCDAFAQIEQARGDVPLTYFEFGTLAALYIFSQHQLDIALLEVGLGGRLDAVNVLDADVAVITGIALDHMDWLGKDLESIGAEKAGILRANQPAIYAALEMPDSIAAVAKKVGANLIRLGVDYTYRLEQQVWHWFAKQNSRRSLPLPNLRGAMQLQNAAAALQVLDCIQATHPITQAEVRQGLLRVQLPGRMMLYRRKAYWMLDVAHNAQAIKALASQVRDTFVPGKKVAIVGILQDKLQIGLFTPLLNQIDHWFVLDLSDEPRGARPQQVAKLLHTPNITLCGKPDNGFLMAEESAKNDDMVLVFGSFITIAAAMRWLDTRAG